MFTIKGTHANNFLKQSCISILKKIRIGFFFDTTEIGIINAEITEEENFKVSLLKTSYR